MQTLITLLVAALTIWFFLALIKPKKFASFLKTKPRLKLIPIYLLAVFLLGAVSNATMTPEERAERAAQAEVRAAQEEQEKIKKQLKENKFASSLNLSNIEQANTIEEFLKSLDISDIKTITHDENLDEPDTGIKGYRLENNEFKNIILYMNPNQTVQAVRYNAQNLYKDGTIYNKISDITLKFDQMSNMQIASEKAIKRLLKAPSTADFSDINETRFTINNGIASVHGYVDAQNSFGAKLRSSYITQFNVKTGELLHLNFDGNDIF